MVLLSSPPLLGQDKWLGGECSWDGRYIYGVPGSAKNVLCIDTETGACSTLGGPFQGKFKWLRGVSTPTAVYALPSNAHSVLKIDPSANACTTIGGPFGVDGWQWHGGQLLADGCVYGVPCNAKQVLKLDPRTDEISQVGGPWEGKHKWYGGIISPLNGAMYCIPQSHQGVLKVCPNKGCSLIDCSALYRAENAAGYLWHGGTADASGRYIFGIPSNADYVLKIDTKLDTCCLIGPKLVSGRHRVNKDGRYKYLGSALGPDGLIYMFPCDAERVLCIDPQTDSVRYIGPTFIGHPPALRTSDRAKYESTVVSEDGNTIHCIGENKWQNGFAAKDGCIYAIPQRAPGILRIAPVDGGDAVVSLVDCGEAFHGTKDLFEGAVMGKKDGHIYCIPLRAKRAVKLVPNSV